LTKKLSEEKVERGKKKGIDLKEWRRPDKWADTSIKDVPYLIFTLQSVGVH
jgi:hypothetical protein